MLPVTATAMSPASTRLHEIVFVPCDVSITAVFSASVMGLPPIVNPPAENAIDWTVRPSRSFVAAGRLDAGNEIAADASPTGEPPIQFEAFEKRSSPAPVQTCVAACAAKETNRQRTSSENSGRRTMALESITSRTSIGREHPLYRRWPENWTVFEPPYLRLWLDQKRWVEAGNLGAEPCALAGSSGGVSNRRARS